MKQLSTLSPNDLWIFATVAESGSFSAASVKTGMPKSTLSRRITQLELQLGERLFLRNTRQIKPTEFGEQLLPYGRQIIEELGEALAFAQYRQSRPSGVLRISLPNDFAKLVLLPLLNEFMQLYPGVKLELDLSPRRVDMINEGFDLAIRMGELQQESSLTARAIGHYVSALYAAPNYLKGHNPVLHPDDLKDHPSLHLLKRDGSAATWELTRGEDRWHQAPSQVRITANSPELLLHFARQGLGIACAPRIYAREWLERNELQTILAEWSTPPITAWAVFPSRKLMPLKTRALLDILTRENHRV